MKKEELSEETIKMLIEKSIAMMDFSYTPYSNFTVGAALLTKQDEVYTGCNIENASFTPTNCAERTAIFKAVSEGKKEFKAIAIVGGPKKQLVDYCYPCGVCRQVMREFCEDDFLIILAKSKDDYKIFTLSEIYPGGFKPEGQVGATALN